MTDVMWIVIGMMLVTYIPRLIPFIMIGDRNMPEKMSTFLTYVPYAALGALIIPGAVNAVPDAPVAAAAGLGFAVLQSYFRGGMILSVVGGIGVTYLVLLIQTYL